MSTPRATLRLQLHRDFTFADAAKLVPYMASLGISHLYSSPIFMARPGSMHGYDVTDPTRVNPELGGEDGLRDLVAALRQAGLGLIVDIVPNHMAAGGMENPWWGDVLQHGRASRYAAFFDIDWDSDDASLNGKVLAPFLGDPYGETLRSGALTLARGPDAPVIRYYDTAFPIRPEDHAAVASAADGAFDPTTEAGRARLHDLLEHQHYRLAWWRSAGDIINWRRFFDINGLAGLRIEDETVFEATHATLLRLYEAGLIDGVRVDHVDGLADPPSYCRRLRARLDALAPQRPATAPEEPAWLVVEKILGAGEDLSEDWAVDGTSGYDFMDLVNALLHDGAGEGTLASLWSAVSGRSAEFATEETVARRAVLDRSFTAQREATVGALHRLARASLDTRDVTRAAIRRGLTGLLAHFPVYRSYGWGGPSEVVERAVSEALRDTPAADRSTLGVLARWLGVEGTPEVAVRFQQLSAPLAAKAVEDTAFYRYGVLLSRNEVGADIRRFSLTAAEFHDANLKRLQRFPRAMLATATHDHKRGEDVRARLAVLSGMADEWAAAVRRWSALNAPHRRRLVGAASARGDEAMLYQMIVGAWPIDGGDLAGFTERLAAWQLKALREAKLATDWLAPDLDYEDAAQSFLYSIMADAGFVAEAEAFALRIGPAGAVNGLAQTLLKLTVPGVPDFYQGAEFWDLSMVDPDNRRAVDFVQRVAALGADAAPVALLETWRDGRVKQAVIHRALTLRRAHPLLFAEGAYVPLEVTGDRAAHAVAFARMHETAQCVVVVPRATTGAELLQDWAGTYLEVPPELAGQAMQDCFTGATPTIEQRMPLERILSQFPAALLQSPLPK